MCELIIKYQFRVKKFKLCFFCFIYVVYFIFNDLSFVKFKLLYIVVISFLYVYFIWYE